MIAAIDDRDDEVAQDDAWVVGASALSAPIASDSAVVSSTRSPNSTSLTTDRVWRVSRLGREGIRVVTSF